MCSASPAAMPCCVMPMTVPPTMLTSATIMPAMLSPLTNFMAPSMAPYIWLSCDTVLRLRCASSMSMTPARMSASMDICLPGMASSVKRAPTSATRSAPLAMTRNCTMVRMTKTTAPTTKLPPSAYSPKTKMISPASACNRMRRVVVMLRPTRKSVVKSSMVGKTEKSRMDFTYIDIISITNESAMLAPMSVSTSGVGSGRIIRAMTTTSSSTMARSLCRVTAPTAVLARASMLMNGLP